MDRGTLSEKNVVARLDSANCIRLRVYVDKHAEFSRTYRVPNPDLRDEDGFAPLPSVHLWTPSGLMVARVDAVVPPEEFLPWLNEALERCPTLAKREEKLRERLAAAPGHSAHHKLLASFYEEQGAFSRAAEAWGGIVRRGLVDGQERHEAALRAGNAYLMFGEYGAAIEVLSIAAEEGTSTREVGLYFLGFACEQAGRNARARLCYRTLIEEFPESRWVSAAQASLAKPGKEYY